MEKITPEELETIHKEHQKWATGEGGSRANLTGANLAGANLTGANLRNANLICAELTGVELTGANLAGANLRNAELTGANLTGAELTGAELTGAYLRNAELTGANLTGANLRNANLTCANLRNAELTGIKMNWRSWDLVGDRLYRAATTLEQKSLAALIGKDSGSCWPEFAEILPEDFKLWAVSIMKDWIHEDDELPKEFESALSVMFPPPSKSKSEVRPPCD